MLFLKATILPPRKMQPLKEAESDGKKTAHEPRCLSKAMPKSIFSWPVFVDVLWLVRDSFLARKLSPPFFFVPLVLWTRVLRSVSSIDERSVVCLVSLKFSYVEKWRLLQHHCSFVVSFHIASSFLRMFTASHGHHLTSFFGKPGELKQTVWTSGSEANHYIASINQLLSSMRPQLA